MGCFANDSHSLRLRVFSASAARATWEFPLHRRLPGQSEPQDAEDRWTRSRISAIEQGFVPCVFSDDGRERPLQCAERQCELAFFSRFTIVRQVSIEPQHGRRLVGGSWRRKRSILSYQPDL